jgi:hypothetical protein
VIVSVVSSLPAEKVTNWLNFYFADVSPSYLEGRKQKAEGD